MALKCKIWVRQTIVHSKTRTLRNPTAAENAAVAAALLKLVSD
jgi:hypothetical protein